jgi:hypothetical protein
MLVWIRPEMCTITLFALAFPAEAIPENSLLSGITMLIYASISTIPSEKSLKPDISLRTASAKSK